MREGYLSVSINGTTGYTHQTLISKGHNLSQHAKKKIKELAERIATGEFKQLRSALIANRTFNDWLYFHICSSDEILVGFQIPLYLQYPSDHYMSETEKKELLDEELLFIAAILTIPKSLLQ